MKDMPAALLVVLVEARPGAVPPGLRPRRRQRPRAAHVVPDDSLGPVRQKSLSSSLQRAFQRWLNEACVGKLLSASIGNDPSLRDVLRLARPTPPDNARRALFGWLTDKPSREVGAGDGGRSAGRGAGAGRVPRGGDAKPSRSRSSDGRRSAGTCWPTRRKGPLVWKAIARQMGPQALRMNLNTLLRHDVFERRRDGGLTWRSRIADADEIRRSRQFPYQFLAAYLNATDEVPQKIKARSAPGGRDRVRQRAGAAGTGRDRSRRVGLDAVAGHGPPWSRCDQQDALRRRGGAVRGGDPASQPGQRGRFRSTRRRTRSAIDPRGLDPEPGGAAGEVRRRWHGLLAAAGRGQRAATRERPFAGCVLVSDNESWVGVRPARLDGA